MPRDLAILTFVTLDGVMQGPSSPDEDRSGGFAVGGWARPYWDEVMSQVRREAMLKPYDMVFGRKTYDIFANHFPKAGKSPEAIAMNAAKKYVATSSPEGLSWKNSEALTGDIAEEIHALKAQDGPLLQVHGSGKLIQTLHTHGLIDEYRLWTFPVVLGSGKRLFEPGCAPANLRLTRTEPCANGVVMRFYRAR